MSLTKEQIVSADDLPREKVDVPEWNGHVYVRTMTGTERDAWEMGMFTDGEPDMVNARAKLCVLTVVDKDGKRVFTDGDAEALGRKSACALDRLFDVARRLSGLSAADVEELEKNSASGQPDGSTSA